MLSFTTRLTRRVEKPAGGLDVRVDDAVALEAPGDSVGDGPESGPFAVQAEVGREAMESAEHRRAAVAEFTRADDRRNAELAFADEGLRIDRQPRLSPRAQD